MKLQTFIDVVDNRYRVEIRIYDTTSLEDELMDQYGEPFVEVGGSFSGTVNLPEGGTQAADFTLPAEQRRLKSDFPLVKYFDLDDDADSDVNAKLYAETITTRLTTAKNTLLTNDQNFVSESVTTV